jgi:hypothetical protein
MIDRQKPPQVHLVKQPTTTANIGFIDKSGYIKHRLEYELWLRASRHYR